MRTLTKTTLAVAAISLGMLAAVACSKPSTEPTAQTTTLAANVTAKASCDTRAALRTCNEFPDRKSYDMEKALCDAEHGKFALTPCPSADQIATCSLSDAETKRYYGSRDQAIVDCEAVGGAFR